MQHCKHVCAPVQLCVAHAQACSIALLTDWAALLRTCALQSRVGLEAMCGSCFLRHSAVNQEYESSSMVMIVIIV